MVSIINTGTSRISIYSDPFNKRIRIDDYSGNLNEILKLITAATPDWAEKLIIKVRENDVHFFQSYDFLEEGYVGGYFNGLAMHFYVKYFTPARGLNAKGGDEEQILEKILGEKNTSTDPGSEIVLLATLTDATALADLYSTVFKVYPTPLGDVSHIRKSMQEDTVYVIIREKNKIVSAASAEINRQFENAELTDCATLPEAQGKGHMKKLLLKLEEILIEDNIHCHYTIARAESYGMNKVFHQLGYTFGGRLVNNCLIYSGLEDMNVWYKWV